MDTKQCGTCKDLKPIFEFYKDSSRKDGLQSRCKQCHASMMHQHYAANKDVILHKNKAYRAINKDSIRKNKKKYRKENKEKIAVLHKKYIRKDQKQHPEKYAAKAAYRRALKKLATPKWADKDAITGIYLVARMFQKTGLQIHVDHIVPLQNNKVCGLHCEANLQLLSAIDNTSKGNRHWPDMW
jgi:hypothetical protein